MIWAVKSLIVLASILVVGMSGLACGGNGQDLAPLEQARADVVEALGMEPLPSQEGPDLGSIKSKAAPVYLTATGRVAGSRDDVASSMPAKLSAARFTAVTPAQPRPHVVAGVRGELVAEIAVYDELGSLPDEPSAVYVQMQIGPRDPALAWTQVAAE
jgi:hypothetical protein